MIQVEEAILGTQGKLAKSVMIDATQIKTKILNVRTRIAIMTR